MTGAVIRTEGRRQSGEVLAKREKEVLASLANKPRVDLRWLSEDEKQRIREVLDELHNGRRLSLLRISQMVGKSYTKIWGLCRALEMPTRNVAEADRNSAELRSKHKRSPFDGTEEERAYMLGFKNGDLTALQVSGTAVMVTSTTTHPAFANLFRELFEKYGPVYQYPMQEKGKGYKWKLAVRLDNSFQFLLASGAIALSLVSRDRRAFMSWLAGLLDSDGSINLTHSNKHARILLVLHNTDLITAIRKAGSRVIRVRFCRAIPDYEEGYGYSSRNQIHQGHVEYSTRANMGSKEVVGRASPETRRKDEAESARLVVE